MSGIDGIRNFSYADLASIGAPTGQSGWSKFGQVMGSVAGAAASFLPGGPLLAGSLGLSASGDKYRALGQVGQAAAKNFDTQMELMKIQEQIQFNSQVVNTFSNISKSKHEAAMAAIRNIK